MPLYDYQCTACLARTTAYRSIETRALAPLCPHCDHQTEKVLSAPAVRGDYAGYTCPVTGTWIEGRRAHSENLKRHNCRVFEPGEREAFDKRRAQADAALDAAVDATVEAEIHNMSARKRELLTAELQAGASADIVRG